MSLNLEVNILGEFKNLTRATKGATKQLKGFQSSTRRISRGIGTALAAIGVGLSFRALKTGIQGAVAEASNLEQAYGAAAAVFKDSSAGIVESSKKAALAYGLSANQFLSSANLIGAQLSNLGFSQDEYTAKTEELVGLGADLAATFGGTAYDAVQALSAVFRGEYNQVEKYGVSIRKSDINARLAAKGQDKLTGEMLKQAEALAALDILYGQTESAQGQFARETGTLAGATQILQASMTNAKIAIGEGFYPIVVAVTQFINDNIGVFDNLTQAIGTRLKTAFEDGAGSVENFGTKVINSLTDLTDFLNGEAGPGNAFFDIQEKLQPVFELFGAFAELLKGVITVLNGVFDGLFGWITLIPGVDDSVTGLAGFIQFLADVLQNAGYWIGWVASLFIPFTAGFKIAGKVIEVFSNVVGRFGAFFKSIFGLVRKVFDDTIGAFAKGIGSVWKPAFGEGLNVVGKFAAGIGEKLRGGPLEGLIKWLTVSVPSAVKYFGGWIDRALGVVRNFASSIGLGFIIPGISSGSGSSAGEDNRFNNMKPKKIDYNQRNKEYAQGILDGIKKGKQTLDSGLTIPEVVLPELTTPEAESEFAKGIKRMVELIEDSVQDAQARIKSGIENFRDSVQLSFGIITNGAFAVFDVNRIIRQMQKIKDAAGTFADDIRKLQDQGADSSLIDQILGMDPISGATAARGLLSSGRLEEFLKLRDELSAIGGSAAEAANLGNNGTSTEDLVGTLDRLNRLIENGVENVYNITVANANNMSAKQIVEAIKSYEKTVGKKVMSN
tara:strand:+ start:7066 stop:9414 length:2349 start_codon:yes stop_codon:yes gene_type:complete